MKNIPDASSILLSVDSWLMALAQVEQRHITCHRNRNTAGNLVINSATQYSLTSYRLSRPRLRDFRFLINSYVAETRVSSFVCDEVHSCLCLLFAVLRISRPVICLWPVSPQTMLTSGYNDRFT